MNIPTPRQALLAGSSILEATLAPYGFAFVLRNEGRSFAGAFASGEFVRDDRRLELHYRGSLGQVQYHAAREKATHEAYMRELGVWRKCKYPGFSSEFLEVFQALAHDLMFTDDFLTGDASVLISAAARESIANAARSERLTADYVGDTREIETMQARFREKRYAEVVAIFDRLHSPHLLSDAQLRLVQLARERADT